MKNIISILFLVFVLIFSCRKKDDPLPPNLTTSGATTGTANGPGVNFNGMCSNQKVYSIIAGLTYPSANAQNSAVFTNSTINNFSSLVGPFLNAGNISLNSKIFKNSAYFYTDSTNISVSGTFVWNGTGTTIPTFTVTNSNPYATYSDYVYWPDTIKKSASFAIYLNGLRNADEVQVLIANTGAPSSITYTALVSAGQVSISAVGLSSLLTFNTAIIQCNFFKNNIQTIGGSQVNFRNITSFIKTVQVKN